MKLFFRSVPFLLAAFFGTSPFASGAAPSSPSEIQSQWRGREIAIDGNDNDWAQTNPVTRDNLTIRAQNDTKYLYLCLASESREVQAQILGSAGNIFTIWLDPQGGMEKTLGIRLSPRRPASAEPFPPEFGANITGTIKDLVLLKPGSDLPYSITMPGAHDIHAQMGRSDRRLVYELQIPLARMTPDPFALAAQPGDAIGILFETSELHPEAIKESGREEKPPAEKSWGRGPGGPPRGGGPPGGGGFSGGMGGGERKPPPRTGPVAVPPRPGKIQIRIKVTLALHS